MRVRRRKIETIETHEVWFMSKLARSRSACACCGSDGQMLTPEEAALLRGVSQLTIYRWMESGLIHFAEMPNGRLFVCLNSLPAEKAVEKEK